MKTFLKIIAVILGLILIISTKTYVGENDVRISLYLLGSVTSIALSIVLYKKNHEIGLSLFLSCFISFLGIGIIYSFVKLVNQLTLSEATAKVYSCQINSIKTQHYYSKFSSSWIELKDCTPSWPSEVSHIDLDVFIDGNWRKLQDNGSQVLVKTQKGILQLEVIQTVGSELSP